MLSTNNATKTISPKIDNHNVGLIEENVFLFFHWSSFELKVGETHRGVHWTTAGRRLSGVRPTAVSGEPPPPGPTCQYRLSRETSWPNNRSWNIFPKPQALILWCQLWLGPDDIVHGQSGLEESLPGVFLFVKGEDFLYCQLLCQEILHRLKQTMSTTKRSPK